jgi:hypothetical protein
MCARCLQNNCKCNRWERSCADCFRYCLLASMREVRGGELVCPGCETKARNKASANAQIHMFDQQSLMDVFNG